MADDLIPTVARQLRLKDTRRDQVIRELHSHLQASKHDLELAGRSPEDAERESVRRFGDPNEVAAMLSVVHRRRIPRVEFVLVAAIGLAGLSAWFGTSHTFASSTSSHAPYHHVHCTASVLKNDVKRQTHCHNR